MEKIMGLRLKFELISFEIIERMILDLFKVYTNIFLINKNIFTAFLFKIKNFQKYYNLLLQ